MVTTRSQAGDLRDRITRSRGRSGNTSHQPQPHSAGDLRNVLNHNRENNVQPSPRSRSGPGNNPNPSNPSQDRRSRSGPVNNPQPQNPSHIQTRRNRDDNPSIAQTPHSQIPSTSFPRAESNPRPLAMQPPAPPPPTPPPSTHGDSSSTAPTTRNTSRTTGIQARPSHGQRTRNANPNQNHDHISTTPRTRINPNRSAPGNSHHSYSIGRSYATTASARAREIEMINILNRQTTLIEQQGRAIADLQRQALARVTQNQPMPDLLPSIPENHPMPATLPPPPQPQINASSDPTDFHPGHPFTPHIMAYQTPQGYLGPTNVPHYNGLTDPVDHIVSFEGAMNYYSGGDEMKCRAFSMTLEPSVLRWYSSLPRNSVNSWEEMKRVFLNRYTASCIQPRSDHTLAAVTQKNDESLKDYLSRFHMEASSVPHLASGVAVLLFTQGLQPGDFRKSLIGKPPKDMAELRQRSNKFINLEEFQKGQKIREERQRTEPQNLNKQKRDERFNGRQDRNDRDRRPPPRNKFQDYTPLTVPRSQILRETMQTDLRSAQRPPSLRKGAQRDRSKYCDFHRGYGHTTDECIWLRDLIEEMIRDGKLQQYIRDAAGRRNRNRSQSPARSKRQRSRSPNDRSSGKQKVDSTPVPEGQSNKNEFLVNTIAGGFAGGGEKRADRKKYINQILAVSHKPIAKRSAKNVPIIFDDEDLDGVLPGHNDPMVITALIGNYEVKRVFIDQGSSADIMFFPLFKALKLRDCNLTPFEGELIGFTGDTVEPKGYIQLPVTLGQQPSARTEIIKFLVVDCPAAYNAILGRTSLQAFGAVVSTVHLAMKFVGTDDRVVTVKAEQDAARMCYNASLGKVKNRDPSKMERLPLGKGNVNLADLDMRDQSDKHRPTPKGQWEFLTLSEEPLKQIKIGADLPTSVKEELTTLLIANKDLFAWTSADMPGIDPNFICHKLSIIPGAKPIAQRKRKVSAEKAAAIEEKVAELLRAGFIREIDYTDWLANTVLVKKPNGKWRMCVDYTDLNKVCPKDQYPLPVIDKLVDNSAGYKLLSFMDAYSGYNQIPMFPGDQDKTAFITDRATYCYNVMPFGLKNAGATYQRMMNKVFQGMIGSNMEVYIDDIIAKSRQLETHAKDLSTILERVRKHSMRLNPEKCVFGVPAGSFLGFMLTERGIEANPDKCKAILDMRSPANLKEVQQLTGRVAALSRFLSQVARKALPWYQLLRKNRDFVWDKHCEQAFIQLKDYLSSPPVLHSPVVGENLILYMSVSEAAVSSVLVRDNSGTEAPIYFVSRALQGSELRYQRLEKLAFCLVTSARRLRQYFQAHKILVRTAQPLRQVLHKPDLAGRMVSWSVELSEFDITYEPRKAMKSQVLADFLSEFTDVSPDCPLGKWSVFVDGSSNKKGAGAGIIIESPEGSCLEYSIKFEFQTSNNQAEYEAVLAGLKAVLEFGAERVSVFSDSQLVVSQVNGQYSAKEPILQKYLEEVKRITSNFSEFSISHVPRDSNARADILSKLASTKGSENNKTLIQETVPQPSVVLAVSLSQTWMDPIITYLQHGFVPQDQIEARTLIRKAAQYTILNGVLYRKGFGSPMLRCVNCSQAEEILEEIHGGICSHHMGGKSLARKVIRAGYFWPTLQKDAMDHVKRCPQCQFHSDVHQKPAEELHSLGAPYPFYQWGMDIIGKFPTAPGQLKFAVVAIDYFTKWIEAMPLATISSARIQSFFVKEIISRFGVPHAIVTDNGSQFAAAHFQQLAADLNIKHYFSSVEHPQTNGLAEAANRTILDGVKKKLGNAAGTWADKLPSVLWSHRTTVHSTTGETPFRLTYGCDAVIPIEKQIPSFRTLERPSEVNDDLVREELVLLEEIRSNAATHERRMKERQAREYNKNVRPRSFDVGDLVLRRADIGKGNAGVGKLKPNWEGPYRVKAKSGSGAYKLETLSGSEIGNTWNVAKLRTYYS